MRLRDAIVAGLITGLLFAGCANGATEPVTEPAAVVARAPKILAAVVAGICIDGSSSVPSRVTAEIVNVLSGLLESWVPPATRAGNKQPASAPLTLRVRKVMPKSSLDASGEVLSLRLPGIPGVIAAPQPEDANYLAAKDARAVQLAEVGELRHAVDEQVAAAVRTLRSANWSSSASEIFGCIEALGRTLTGPDRHFILVSDLDQNRKPQTGLVDLGGVGILVIHVASDADVLAVQEGAARHQWADVQHAQVDFRAPEVIADVVPSFIRNGKL